MPMRSRSCAWHDVFSTGEEEICVRGESNGTKVYGRTYRDARFALFTHKARICRWQSNGQPAGAIVNGF